MAHQLLKKIIITGQVHADTGLMIGASGSALEIGGTDKQIIRNPKNKKPYIPGSSLKGKMRSLMEQSHGTVQGSGDPTMNPDHVAARLFGYIKARNDDAATEAQKRKNKEQQPSRLIVRDGEMLNTHEFEGKTELLYTEVKAENTINRITAEANPRFFERVPKGAIFDLNMSINIFEDDDDKDKLLDFVFEAMRLVQDDYLGGGGTRGNGLVRFVISAITERSGKYYKGEETEKPLTEKIPKEFKSDHAA